MVSFTVEAFERACEMLEIDPMSLWQTETPPSTELDGVLLSRISEIILDMEKHNDGSEYSLYFYSTLPMLIYPFIRTADKNADEIPRWLTEILKNMNEPVHFSEGLPYMLAQSDFSQEHFTREFRRYVCMTPTEFINMKRLNYAGKLLLSGQHKISEICCECGFKSLCYFYHIFKTHFGCTPKQFIENQKTPTHLNDVT